jgi:hypothetical protein
VRYPGFPEVLDSNINLDIVYLSVSQLPGRSPVPVRGLTEIENHWSILTEVSEVFLSPLRKMSG